MRADADAEARWKAFKIAHRDRVDELRSWNPPGALFADGACNAVLERARETGQALQEMMPSLVQTSAAPKIAGVAGELGKIVGRISNEQSAIQPLGAG